MIDNNCDYTVKGFQRTKSFAKNAKNFVNFRSYFENLIPNFNIFSGKFAKGGENDLGFREKKKYDDFESKRRK